MISNESLFFNTLKNNFPFELTSNQNEFLFKLSNYMFIFDKKTVFVLKGFAGTGKTTLLKTIVNSLKQINFKYILLAPTGRAAKVMSSYTLKESSTIHRKIYFTNNSPEGLYFQLKENKHVNTLFIVDECSMIEDTLLANERTLLHDFITYVQHGKNCKILFIGDQAQLPPVKVEESPVLDETFLERKYNLTVIKSQLTQVMRQALDSGILFNATKLRQCIENNEVKKFKFSLKDFNDIESLNDGEQIQDAFYHAYKDYRPDESCFVVKTNKRANSYNQQLRYRILDQENMVSAGELFMVVKNNYYWMSQNENDSFIANGDTIKINKILKFINLYDFEFIQAEITLIDYPNIKPLETIILLDTLKSESASLSPENSQLLYEKIYEDYLDTPSHIARLRQVKNNPFYNALQVKYAYTVTCHKAQGGQWNSVFVEKPYLQAGENIAYYRWLYTAITRAKTKLYLIGFDEEDFDN